VLWQTRESGKGHGCVIGGLVTLEDLLQHRNDVAGEVTNEWHILRTEVVGVKEVVKVWSGEGHNLAAS
jgi:hypothetical protein